MLYVILSQKKDGKSVYKDKIGEEYHFPVKYKINIQEGNTFVYYQPGDNKNNYFGVGTVGEINSIDEENYLAKLINYKEFINPVHFKIADDSPIKTPGVSYIEDLGYENKRERPPFEWSIRPLSEEAFNYIMDKAEVKTTDAGISTEKRNTSTEKRNTSGENILLYGVPGSGKSWIIQKEYCQNEDCIERVVFYPDYMYSDFVGQILPCVNNENKGVEYKFLPGPFTKIMKKAYENPMQVYYLIIEEINRGNAPAVFGEIFQLLDRKIEDEKDESGKILYTKGTSEYGITNANMARIIYGDEDHKIRIPSNLTILATMNSSDQNVFTLDTAFQRRWIMRMIPNTFDNNHSLKNIKILDTNVLWEDFCNTINSQIIKHNNNISSEDKRLGTYFVTKDDLTFKNDNDSADKVYIKHHNSQFAEKVLKYLWDDAFKYSHANIFDLNKFDTLEKIIESFTDKTGDDRFNVFSEILKNELLKGINSSYDSDENIK